MVITNIESVATGFKHVCDGCGWAIVLPKKAIAKCPRCPTVAVPAANEVTRPSPQPPGLARQAFNYAKAAAAHVAAGRPICSDEQVAERFAICQACPLFRYISEGRGKCAHSTCGCSLKAVGLTGRNKLRWADQVCPYTEVNGIPSVKGGDHKPKWTAISIAQAEASE